MPVEPLELFGSTTTLFYTPQEYRAHLENIIRLLEIFPKFNLFLSRRNPLKNIRLSVKDEAGVIVAKTDHPPAVFAFNQQNMINAFHCYLEEVIGRQHQKATNRQQVIEELRKLAWQLPS